MALDLIVVRQICGLGSTVLVLVEDNFTAGKTAAVS